MELEEEIWKPFRDSFYEGSNFGRVRSLDHYTIHLGGKRFIRGQIVKHRVWRNQRCIINIRLNNKITTMILASFICECFHGPRPVGLLCCHNDGNAFNNRPENLRWDTQQSNMQDMVKHGHSLKGISFCKGENNTWHILTWKKVNKIRYLYNEKDSKVSFLAKKYNVGYSAIHSIVKNRTWKDNTYIPKKTEKKITIEKAMKARQLYRTGNYTQVVLAKMFSISKGSISNILLNKILY